MKSKMMTLRLLPLALTLIWLGSGCVTATRIEIIPSDREVKRIKAGAPFESKVDGWFYPDAIHMEVGQRLGEKVNRKP